MSWDDQGNNKNPWGGGDNQGPPDLDEVVQKLQQRFNKFLGGKKSSGGGVGPSLLAVWGLAFVGLSLLWGVWGFYINEPAERSVILRLGTYHETTLPGIHWRMPLVDQKFTVNVEAVRDFPSSALMLTKDENIVDIDLNVQYKIKDAKNYVLKVRSPDETIRHASESALRQVVGHSNLDNVITEGRAAIALESKTTMQALLDNYGTGLVVTQVNMQKADPPQAVIAAFDDVIKAREDKERTINQAKAYSNEVLPIARGNAQRVLEEANAYKEQVVKQARGEAARFKALLTEYVKAPEVTRKRLYLDAVESVLTNSSKVVVDVKGGNNLLYLPLDQLVRQGTLSPTRQSLPAVDFKVPQLNGQANNESSDESTIRRRGRGRSLR